MPEVQQRIIEIVNQGTSQVEIEAVTVLASHSLHPHIEQLQQQLLTKENELEQLKSEMRAKDTEQLRLKSEIIQMKKQEESDREARRRLEENNIELGQPFNKLRLIYKQWLNDSPSLQNRVGNIIKSGSFEHFVVSSVQYDSLLGLWDFAQGEIQSAKMTEADRALLTRIIEEGMNAYNIIYEQPLFQIYHVAVGNSFDEDTMSRAGGSKPSGAVNALLLPGILNVRTGKWIRKSFVTVGGTGK